MTVNYNQLAEAYKKFRRPDPRIAAQIHAHLVGAKHILNVGAGSGSYEPDQDGIAAVEPSHEMIAKRVDTKTALIQGIAEALPFKDNCFDVSMGILTIHHWSDIVTGLKEMARVSRVKIILFTWIGYDNNFWLTDYIPEIKGIDEALFPSIVALEQTLGNISVETVPIPHDCTDGFMCAYWRRPEAYLDPVVRKAISTFARIGNIQSGLARLAHDLKTGTWHTNFRHLSEMDHIDLGYRLVVCDLPQI